MKKNQNGFGLIETLCVVLVLTLVGIAGWFVYKNNQANEQSVSNPTTSESIVSDLPFTYNKPSGWTEKREDTQTSGELPNITYQTPDFKPADGMGIEKGASILITADKSEQKTLDEFLAFDDLKQYSYITNHKRFNINDIDAYSYDVDYEGQRHNTVFYHDSVEYTVILEWAINDEQSLYRPSYEALIESIAFN